jgi:AraC-like DNA-binding protein
MPGKPGVPYKWKAPENAVTILVNLSGAVDLQLEGHEKPISFAPGTCNMFYAVSAEGQVTNRENYNEMLVVQYEATAFLELAQQSNLLRLPFIDGVKSNKPILLFGHSNPLSLAIERITTEVTNPRFDEKYRPFLLAGKCPELLMALLELHEKTGDKKWVHCRTEYDRERIEFARNYLLQNAGQPPSLTELSRLAGINQLKLKMGFKEVFGQTVFAYLNEYRLQKAQEEIGKGGKSLTQIAFELGFSSLQHFSGAYKKRYGKAAGRQK